MAPDPEPFDGLPLDEPLIDAETWDKAGRALVQPSSVHQRTSRM